MSTPAKPIPDGYHTLTTLIFIRGAAQAIEFYKKAFGATEMFRMAAGGGKLMHAEIKIGNSVLMLCDELPEMGALSPQTVGGCPICLRLYVADSDAMTAQAVAAGATIVRPLENQPWGDRSSTVADPFGYQWSISTHIEDVSYEEVNRRLTTYLGLQGGDV